MAASSKGPDLMLAREEDVEAHALKAQGWTVSAIARHLGRDPKTIRAYLSGERTPGVRASAGPDRFEKYAAYCTERLGEDPHLWATALLDEVSALGYDGGYSSFTRALRARGLRPACEPCRPAKGRPVAIIDHPVGEETQWDWLELPDPPGHWDGYDRKAFLLVGALAHSGKWRGQLCERADAAHLADALHQVAGQLGGLTRSWRFDRMSSVAHPGTGKVTATFAALAKHYAVSVALCPPRRGNRKGVVEKANHTAAQRWWRNLPEELSAVEAQARLEVFCATKTDSRTRVVDPDGTRMSVGELAATERLRPLPAVAFPATVRVERTVRAQALVAFRGNRYSVPPELAGARVSVTHRLGSSSLEVVTASGTVLARHRRAPDGAGVTIRTDEHVTALDSAALAAFSTAAPHRRKQRIPPGPAARTAAAVLLGQDPATTTSASTVIDLAPYAAAAERRRSLP
jgi:transposase